MKNEYNEKHYLYLIDIFAAVFLLLTIMILIHLFSMLLFPFDKLQDTFYESRENITVVLDAGHGGEDDGAVYGEAIEKILNFEIVKKIAEYLSMYDVNVLLTRTSDSLIANKDASNKKREDLRNRVNIASSIDEPVFVSIHMNSYPEERYKGLQVFYSPNDPYSEALALVIQSNNAEILERDNLRSVKRATSSIYVLDRLFTPSVLIECGFLSNPDDRIKLCDESYQSKLAFVIACSIIEYIEL